MPIISEGEEIVFPEKKQPVPVTSTSNGQAVTPPPTSTPITTGAFEPPPIVSKQPTVPATQPATFLMQQPTGQPDPTTLFWAGLGVPQYIGRYAPFEIPSGYKVASMVEQNGQLLISFESTARSISPSLMKNLENFATEAQQITLQQAYDEARANYVPSPTLMKNIEAFAVEGQQNLLDLQAKEFAESDYGKLLEANLGAKRMYESALAAGRPPPTFSLITPTIITQQTQMQEQKPTLQEAYQQYHDVRVPELLKGESEIFYKSIGFTQYGGKYAPFNVPEGAKIQDITATPQGLLVTFKYLPQTQTQTAIIGKSPLNVGQTVTIQRAPLPEVIPSLTGWLLSRSKEAAKYEQFMAPSPMKSAKGLENIAGFVASGESLINPRTPFIVSPSFIGGYIFGAIVSGYAIGKVVQPIVQPLTQALASPIQSKATTWLTKSYEESLRAGELWKPSLTERIVMGITGAKPTELPRSIVGLPTLIEEGPAKVATSNRLDVRGLQATLGLGPEEYKQLPSLIAGEDLLGFTDVPRTAGYGLTRPLPVNVARQLATLPLTEIEGMGAGLSSITAKWFLPKPSETIPHEALSFTKEPQTYRVAQDSTLSFSKQFGALPTKSGLLSQIVEQEAKAVAVSSGMPNVFGPAVTTIQKTTTPFITATLGEMTSWLVRQETRIKTMESAITPLSLSFQSQPRTKQIDETQYLTYPGQPLTVNIPTRETRETVVSPILDLGAGIISLGRQGAGTVESLSLLEKQVYQITQPQKPLVSNILTTPLLEGAVTQKQEQITPLLTLNLLQNLTPGGTVTPRLDIPTLTTPGTTPKLIIPTIFDVPNIPPGTYTTPIPTPPFTPPPKLFTLPKSGLGGLGPREPASLLYPFGRQKRKYPVMTGGQVVKFLFSQPEKRRKKK